MPATSSRLPGSPGPNHGGALPTLLYSSDSEGDASDGSLLLKTAEPLKTRTSTQCLRPLETRANRPPEPRHPLAAMQQAFSESLVEATHSGQDAKPKLRVGHVRIRRDDLLEQAKDDPAPAVLWRYRPGQQCHELRRLVAQVSFGVYLLLNGLANSQASVVSILQGHIDEIDEFLETALEDIDLATEDMSERIHLLNLPMDNMDVFKSMLEEEPFRLQILDGNGQIDHIVSRTETALAQYEQDFAEGIKATKEFMIYLQEEEDGQWRQARPEVMDIFDAMKGNTDGWWEAFLDLQSKECALRTLIIRLNRIVADVERLAGNVSRRAKDSTSSLAASCRTASSVFCSDSPPTLSSRISNVAQDLDFDLPVLPLATKSSRSHRFESLPALHQMEAAPDPIGPPPTPPMRNAARVKARASTPEVHAPDTPMTVVTPPAGGEAQKGNGRREDSTGEELPLYVLQPRTYTPQASPLPSPFRGPPSPLHLSPEYQRPTALDGRRPHSDLERCRPEYEQHLQAPRPESEQPREKGTWPTRVSRTVARAEPPSPDLGPCTLPSRMGTPPSPEQRTSMRRTSLRRSPPQTIHVPPPPNILRIQRPTLHSYTSDQGDAAYSSSSNVDRGGHTSMTSPKSLADLSQSLLGSNLVSTHSDQQFFMPVQASPNAPLQQRPHTSHLMTPPHTAPLLRGRHVPSGMGLSMLSNVEECGSPRALKKKRSAFKWLKKAFSLDEEERAQFEARKREQTQNLYYEPRSPRFLDGRRINPRPMTSQHLQTP